MRPPPVILLWWGTDLRILAGDGALSALALGEAGDPVSAILQWAEAAGAAARAIRIIYHPGTLDVQETACPNTTRSRLQRTLVREFRALETPGAVWSSEPVRKGLKGYATVLYLDKSSRLPQLVEGLAALGKRVEGAWPLQSLVEAAPPCAAARGGFLAWVSLGGRTLVSCIGPAGDRSVRFFDGPESREAAVAEAGAKLARFEDAASAPGLIVAEAGPPGDGFALAATALTAMTPAVFLGHARVLVPGGFSDFIHRKSLLARAASRRRVLTFAGIVLLAGALRFAWDARQDRDRAQRQAAARREQQDRLQEWRADREAAERRSAQSAQELARIQTPGQPHYDFLAALSQATPEVVTLEAVTIRDGAFAVRGRRFEAPGRFDALPRLWDALGGPGFPWRLEAGPAATSEAEFMLKGSFQARPSGEIAGPATGIETQLAEARARLPSAETFDRWVQSECPHWIVAARSMASLPDLEQRRYALVYDRPKLDSWPDILKTIKALCAEPGLTIDRLTLASAPDGADAFQQAEIDLSVRLRP